MKFYVHKGVGRRFHYLTNLVSTKEDLIKANGQNIYLLNDIDLEGAAFQFGTYVKKEIEGNGYSIKNLSMDPNVDAGFVGADSVADAEQVVADDLHVAAFGAGLSVGLLGPDSSSLEILFKNSLIDN